MFGKRWWWGVGWWGAAVVVGCWVVVVVAVVVAKGVKRETRENGGRKGLAVLAFRHTTWFVSCLPHTYHIHYALPAGKIKKQTLGFELANFRIRTPPNRCTTLARKR